MGPVYRRRKRRAMAGRRDRAGAFELVVMWVVVATVLWVVWQWR
jgi:hypothetical protein